MAFVHILCERGVLFYSVKCRWKPIHPTLMACEISDLCWEIMLPCGQFNCFDVLAIWFKLDFACVFDMCIKCVRLRTVHIELTKLLLVRLSSMTNDSKQVVEFLRTSKDSRA